MERVQSKLLHVMRPVECKPIIYTSIKIHVYSRQYSTDTIVYIDSNTPKCLGWVFYKQQYRFTSYLHNRKYLQCYLLSRTIPVSFCSSTARVPQPKTAQYNQTSHLFTHAKDPTSCVIAPVSITQLNFLLSLLLSKAVITSGLSSRSTPVAEAGKAAPRLEKRTLPTGPMSQAYQDGMWYGSFIPFQ